MKSLESEKDEVGQGAANVLRSRGAAQQVVKRIGPEVRIFLQARGQRLDAPVLHSMNALTRQWERWLSEAL